MAFLDFINNRNASPAPSVDSLPANVKAQAVEAARPAAQLLEKATTPQTPSGQPTPSDSPARGRSLGMER
jgi:hypothetical protein